MLEENLVKFGEISSVRKFLPHKTESRKFVNIIVEFQALDAALAAMDELDETVK